MYLLCQPVPENIKKGGISRPRETFTKMPVAFSSTQRQDPKDVVKQ